MKQSKFLIPTTKNIIDDNITCKSFALMQKAGMIKQVAAGVYSYLPLTYIILRKIEQINREEMNRIDSAEMLMPILQPREAWEESGRWSKYGTELMRMQDRHERDFCLQPTSEEIITLFVRDNVKSWRSLPLSFYQIQTKFRDERRPRFGLMRGREFIMKDAYSFHVDAKSLDVHYEEMREAYNRVFERCGLKTIMVQADNGAIGGSASTEFMSISEIGEDTLVYCDKCGYQANLEKAVALYDEANNANEDIKEVEFIDTPGIATINQISAFLNVNPNRTAKYITYIDDENDVRYLVVIPGNYEINETKLSNLVNGQALRLLTDEELVEEGLYRGFIGAVNFKTKNNFKIVLDKTLEKTRNFTAGGNVLDKHYINVNYPRDFKADFIGDIKEVKKGDLCTCNEELEFAKGIEVGHLFKLGTVYSKPLKCNYLDKNQKEHPMEMGCYGIGISRILMAVVEKYAKNNNKIIFPKELQPFDVHMLVVDIKKQEQLVLANNIYQMLLDNKIDVLYDDRPERIGSKFADSDLIGVSLRIVVGKKANENIVEFMDLREEKTFEIGIDEIVSYINNAK